MLSVRRNVPAVVGLCLMLWGGGPGCSDEYPDDESGFGQDLPLDPRTGKSMLDVSPSLGKADGFDGSHGPPESTDANAQVWKVSTRWYRKDAAAGMAWKANSGLTWDEKFSAWVASLKKITSHSGYNKTFILTTPWGKQIQAPALECAEAAMFLRTTFASWYGLPYYMEAYSSSHGRIYYGHFGIVDRSGSRLSGTPRFKTSYEDHSSTMAGSSDDQIVANWPKDTNLRARYLTSLKDDENFFIADGAYSGAYFDEIFLNKRTGYLLLWLLTNFGSMHVANAKNTFNLEPVAVREGDPLVERWQRKGIGHVMVVKTVTKLEGERLDAELVYGSMPRIQPKWYNSSLSKSYFISEETGGEGSNHDGEEYAKLGGGLKRWRTPVVKYGYWYNIVPAADRKNWISSTDYKNIARRPAEFEKLLGQISAEEQRKVYLQEIANARQNLQLKPASCSNRQRREEAFARLYKINKESFNISKEETDKKHRKLEDYMLAQLLYNKSKTCCWNSSTEKMFQLILKFNKERVKASPCVEPLVFKAVNGGYDDFKKYAEAEGVGHLWKSWSEDESCPQASDPLLSDTEETHDWTPFCTIAADLLGSDSTPDTGAGN